MKKYVIFAGVNGAGKTTLYQTNEEYLDLPRVNVDETTLKAIKEAEAGKMASFSSIDELMEDLND